MRTNSRALMFIMLAVVSALITLFLMRSMLSQERPLPRVEAAPVVVTEPVIIARQDLPAGVAILESQVEMVDWPKAFLPAGRFSAPADVDRRVVKRALQKGEPILESTLLPIGSEAGLSSLIDKNYRGMSVKVDAVVGVAGFIKPGAHVDVLATLRRDNPDGREVPYTRVILQDVEVLAIDQDLEERSGQEPKVVRVVTLEVDPKQAQRLAFAASQGTLQLALRNPQDTEIADTPPVGSRDLMPLPTPVRRRSAPVDQIETIRGSSSTTTAVN